MTRNCRMLVPLILLVSLVTTAAAQSRRATSPPEDPSIPCTPAPTQRDTAGASPDSDVLAYCRLVDGRFRRLMAQAPSKGRLQLSAQRGMHGEVTVESFVGHIPTAAAWEAERRRSGAAMTVRDREDIVPHEIGHWLARTTQLRLTRDAPASQTQGLVPAWLDEAMAVWMEPLESRLGRIRTLRADGRRAAVTQTLFTSNPAAPMVKLRSRTVQVDPPCPRCGWSRWRKVTTEVGHDDSIREDTTFFVTEDALKQSDPTYGEAPLFYSSSLAMLALIRHERGPDGVRQLVRDCVAQSKRGSVARSSCGIPWSAKELQQKWNAWLARPAKDDTLLAGGPDPVLAPARRASAR